MMNLQETVELEELCDFAARPVGEERKACLGLDPKGFFIRHPPTPHHLISFITPEEQLFQTIHMGGAVIDTDRYSITVDGLVRRPFRLPLAQLKKFPSTTLTAFHECYGSPLKPPTENLWRVGNVRWTGVRLQTLLDIAQPHSDARYVWSEGLDSGDFAGITADRYQKDLPIAKALSPEVLLAYEMNGEPLTRNRGGPVRLIVPGWFGTNMTKWLCRLSLQADPAPGPFTTTFYNENDPNDSGLMRPVWMVEPNSMIVSPPSGAQLESPLVEVRGWAWSNDGIEIVQICVDDDPTWLDADVVSRHDFNWQKFSTVVTLSPGSHRLTARATCSSGLQQPLSGRRNHVHTIGFEILD
jgi:DMSO/TMAO reductase YedYZ molybdopterin-dependent catalytic subunit